MTNQRADAADYREALELLVEAFSTPSTPGGYWPVNNAKIIALRQARQVLDDNLVSHRHAGWEGPAEACPICCAHDALRTAETNELKVAAKLDDLRAQYGSLVQQNAELLRQVREARQEAESAYSKLICHLQSWERYSLPWLRDSNVIGAP